MTICKKRSHHGVQLGTIGALLALGLLWAAGPLRSELLPVQLSATLPRLAAQALPLTLLAIATGAAALRRKANLPCGRQLRSAVWIGLGLFTAPALLVHLSAPWISRLAQTALFTLVPVFSVVLEPYLGQTAARPVPGSLPTALLTVLGALLVFPVISPGSIETASAIAASILAAGCIAAANCYAVAVYQNFGHPSAAPITAVAASVGALSLGIASLLLERPALKSTAFAPELLWAAAIELPALLLLFWLMQRLSAVRIATRFVLGPLLAVPLGALLVQSRLASRTWLGLLAMAAGAAYLLIAPEAAEEPATLLGGSPEA